MEERQDLEEWESLTTKRKRIMIYFVEAAEKLIREEGVDGLSIRKIANEAGYNSATIYNYFQDLEHLALFGSVHHLRDYVTALGGRMEPGMTGLQRFWAIYTCFNDFAFRSPEVFHNMFFGRRSQRLEEVLHVYYERLFPDELAGLSPELRRMLMMGDMRRRDEVIMQSLVAEGWVAAQRADVTLDLITALVQHTLYEATVQGPALNVRGHQEKFNRLFRYILDMGRAASAENGGLTPAL